MGILALNGVSRGFSACFHVVLSKENWSFSQLFRVGLSTVSCSFPRAFSSPFSVGLSKANCRYSLAFRHWLIKGKLQFSGVSSLDRRRKAAVLRGFSRLNTEETAVLRGFSRLNTEETAVLRGVFYSWIIKINCFTQFSMFDYSEKTAVLYCFVCFGLRKWNIVSNTARRVISSINSAYTCTMFLFTTGPDHSFSYHNSGSGSECGLRLELKPISIIMQSVILVNSK